MGWERGKEATQSNEYYENQDKTNWGRIGTQPVPLNQIDIDEDGKVATVSFDGVGVVAQTFRNFAIWFLFILPLGYLFFGTSWITSAVIFTLFYLMFRRNFHMFGPYRKLTFDTNEGVFYFGGGFSNEKPYTNKKQGKLSSIQALQLIDTYRSRGKRRKFTSFEINLVFHDGTRRKVMETRSRDRVFNALELLHMLLDVPVWEYLDRDRPADFVYNFNKE